MLEISKGTNTTGGKNSPIVAGDINNSSIGDTNIFLNDLKEDTADLLVVDGIFNDVIKKIKNDQIIIDTTHLSLNEKIKLNFINEADQQAVKRYCEYALIKISLIERRLQEEDSETQKDIQSYVFEKYTKLKQEKTSNLDILHSLFDYFILVDKKNDARYIHLAKAFILFFFDDCTIFEKTKNEISL